MPLRFTIQELSKYVEEIFPQVKDDFEILEISEFGSRVRLKVTFRHLRPGNTVSGPSIFSLVVFILNILGENYEKYKNIFINSFKLNIFFKS